MNVKIIDLMFQGQAHVIASYILESTDGLIMIETGPGSTIKTAQERLNKLGFTVGDVKHVLLTHIHLDHGGAAGWWAQQGAHIYVHEVGAPHLIDPSRLMRSAGRIYGDQMDTLWGEMLPVPPEALTSLSDNDSLELGGIKIKALDTPGHAYHHMTYLVDNIAFTGDVGGASVPAYGLIDAATPPPEFNLEAWHNSVDRLLSLDLNKIYLTHFGEINQVKDHLTGLKNLLAEATELIRIRLENQLPEEQITADYRHWYRQRVLKHNVPESVFATLAMSNQPTMSVSGIARYWRKKQSA